MKAPWSSQRDTALPDKLSQRQRARHAGYINLCATRCSIWHIDMIMFWLSGFKLVWKKNLDTRDTMRPNIILFSMLQIHIYIYMHNKKSRNSSDIFVHKPIFISIAACLHACALPHTHIYIYNNLFKYGPHTWLIAFCAMWCNSAISWPDERLQDCSKWIQCVVLSISFSSLISSDGITWCWFIWINKLFHLPMNDVTLAHVTTHPHIQQGCESEVSVASHEQFIIYVYR